VTLVIFAIVSWRTVLEPRERAVILDLIGWSPRRPAKVI
jgi:hypothetical protein